MMATQSTKRWTRWFPPIATAAGLMMLSLVGGAWAGGNSHPGIAPVNSRPHGATYGEWNARWWQWALSLPTTGHPLYDTAPYDTGQEGAKVIFLGASFAPTVGPGGVSTAFADRSITIRPGTFLFVPIANTECSDLEGNGSTYDQLAACASGIQGAIDPTSLSFTIDGREVQDLVDYYSIAPELNQYQLPATDNVLNNIEPLPDLNGQTGNFVAAGYSLMLTPLPVGEHTIHFTAAFQPPYVFFIDVTYHITVTP
jgi:hypothetical protein